MSKPTRLSDEEIRTFTEDVASITQGRCIDRNIRHPGDVAFQVVDVAEIVAAYLEQTRGRE